MKAPKFVAYYRVSTTRQGASGLGLEAQQNAVAAHLMAAEGRLLGEFTEIESGRKDDRPKLAAAIAACRRHRATLLIARLDRLARRVSFISALMDSGIEFIACDMPSANRLTVHILAAVAEEETRSISHRTKVALAAAKARGVRLGGARPGTIPVDPALGTAARIEAANRHAADVGPVAAKLRQEGQSLREIASALTDLGVATPRGGIWTAASVRNVLLRHGR